MTDRSAGWIRTDRSGIKTKSVIKTALVGVLLLLLIPLPAGAGMDVMTNHEMGRLDAGRLVELSVSDNNFYSSTTPVTVVRFASDIYIEAYGQIGALKMGDYPRSTYELGDMASMDSNYTMVYGPQDRRNPGSGERQWTPGGTGGDNPYYGNTNRTDRVSDRYTNGSSSIELGNGVYLRAGTPAANFGASNCTEPETQWDVNWENVRFGVNEDYPLRMYGLVLRAEFDNWNTSSQHLRRLIIGSNSNYGYSSARPMVTSGWLSSEMAKLRGSAADLTNQTCFQLQRDPIMDQYWSLCSFNFDPDNPTSDGSFRQFWFNTCMNDITVNPASNANLVGRFQERNHGFFFMVDLTDRRFSGWNIIGGVNEYEDWPPLEQDDDHYFENEFK